MFFSQHFFLPTLVLLLSPPQKTCLGPCPFPKISANGAPAEKDSVFNRRPASSEINPGVTLAWKMEIIHPPFVNPCVLEQCNHTELPRGQSKSWWFHLVNSSTHLVFPPQLAHEGGHVHRERGGVFQQGGGGQTFQ